MSKSNPPQRIAFLGSYLPRLCGIATFTHDLCEAVKVSLPDAECYVGAINDRTEGYDYSSQVRFDLLEKDLDSYRRAADFLNFNNADVLCVQHEFGIYGGPAGSHLLALLKEVRMPVVTTLHTVLREPNQTQRAVMNELLERSQRIVVMAKMGRDILHETYGVSESKVDVISHGIPDIPYAETESFKAQFGVAGRTVLLTFGLLGPGKGIEYAIDALPAILRAYPNVVYLILGATHPQLIAREGERYRLSLERLAEDRGVKDHVIFYDRFVSIEDLCDFIRATDIYLTPYLDAAQVTSGTLAYVFGAGKAVVSTPYWHAQELLADGRGVLVPFKSSQAIADGVCEFLDHPDRMEGARQEAYRLGRSMIWSAVADRYVASFQHARADHKIAARTAVGGWTLASRPYELPPLRLDHILTMSDDTGILQHAIFNVPDYHEGYCTDDNARALILCNLLDEYGSKSFRDNLNDSTTTYLSFLAAAFNPNTGRFRNFMNYERRWLEEFGSEDSHGRALWAVGTGAARSRNDGQRRLCAFLFERGLASTLTFNSPRAWAFTLLGVHEFLCDRPNNSETRIVQEQLIAKMTELWRSCASQDWQWFESIASYDNARLSQAMILSGRSVGQPDLIEIGLKSLRWLVSLQRTQAGHFRPVGSNGFCVRGGARADFDQQPVEAQAMVSACLEGFRATRDDMWWQEARRAFEWFLGRNDLSLPLYDSGTGGCCDGLHSDRVSENQGAESSLAFHLARAEMSSAKHPLIGV